MESPRAGTRASQALKQRAVREGEGSVRAAVFPARTEPRPPHPPKIEALSERSPNCPFLDGLPNVSRNAALGPPSRMIESLLALVKGEWGIDLGS